MYNFRTDLAVERREIFKKANKIENEIDGVETESITDDKDIITTRVKITSEAGEKALGKPIGNYITIDIKKIKSIDEDKIIQASDVLARELKTLIDMQIGKTDDILVVGLGNQYVTPDALGPRTITDIDVTRHILNYMPELLEQDTRPVSAISPGVLGTTGIETLEILKGIVDNIKPKLIIVIDALASRSVERISSTIQIADTGIIPGAGVGNTRKELSKKTLGIPVIALGIPTVVESAVLVNDCLDLFIENLQQNAKSNEYLNKMREEDNYEKIKKALIPNDYNMIVTPKEIDELIDNMKNVVARGINYAI